MINTEKFNQVVADAKEKAASDPKWLRAIEKASKAILSGEMIVTTLAHGALVTTANGTYAANGHCNCEAARRGHTQCYHRAAARLMDLIILRSHKPTRESWWLSAWQPTRSPSSATMVSPMSTRSAGCGFTGRLNLSKRGLREPAPIETKGRCGNSAQTSTTAEASKSMPHNDFTRFGHFHEGDSTMKRSFGQRINTWLHESPGEVFRQGKWRFWFPTLIGLTALNAVMTAVIFGADGAQKYIGSIVVMAGAVLCWLALGLLHYSDSEDRALAIGVAVLDSVTLLFVAAHFSFLLWCQGHLWNLRAAEAQYRQDMATYNAQWVPVKDSNERIAATVERVAEIEKQTERLRNDTAYWSRRNGVKQAPTSGLKFEAAVTP